MLAKSDMFAGGYYCGPYKPPGESEGSGSLGRTDTGIAASEDSSAPTRKCISLNPDKCDTFGVAIRVLSLSNMSESKRKDLIHRLRHELKQIQMLQKKVELQRTNGVTVSVSSSSDIFSYTGGQIVSHVQDFQKSSRPGKKGNPLSGTGKGCWLNRGSSGKIESTKHASAAKTANIILMKQCEGLLKRLMGHQCGWVFNQPVDIVKLNIPDYFTVIRHPMDLGTIKKKIASGAYASPLEFHADVRLTFSNAMTYNPPSNDFHVMADTLNKFFEVRWKNIKKLPGTGAQFLQSKAPAEDLEISKTMPPAKKRKTTSVTQENIQESIKRMTDEEKHNLGRELESLLTNMPMHIIDFLREHGSNGRESGEEEMEIDIDELSDDTLFKLRKLLDHYLQEKQKNRLRAEPCEIELLYESGLSNSSMQQGKGNDLADEDVDIGGNEPPVSSYPPVEIEKDTCHISAKSVCSGRTRDSDSGSSSYNESDGAKASSPVDALKVLEAVDSEAQLNENTSVDNPLDRNQCVSRFDQLELTSQPKPSSVELDGLQDGDSAPTERQISPEKLYRAALLKNRFADTILKAREKTLTQGDKGDPDKLCWDREELEQRRKKEKARLQAEAKAAEDARRRAEAEAAVEARRKRELEREKARLALLKMEKTVEINENFRFLEDLEMLRAASAEQLPSSVDETSPDHSQDGLGSFKFGSSNPLEQLGLYMKEDEEEEEEEEGEPASVSNPVNDVEEGEID